MFSGSDTHPCKRVLVALLKYLGQYPSTRSLVTIDDAQYLGTPRGARNSRRRRLDTEERRLGLSTAIRLVNEGRAVEGKPMDQVLGGLGRVASEASQ